MSIFDDDLFAFRRVHSGVILLGDRGTFFQAGMTEVGLILQNVCDLIRTFAASTQFQDILHDGSGFFIENDFLTVYRTLLVAIRCFATIAFTTFGLHPLDSTYLLLVSLA